MCSWSMKLSKSISNLSMTNSRFIGIICPRKLIDRAMRGFMSQSKRQKRMGGCHERPAVTERPRHSRVHVVGEVQRDFIRRKISVLDVLGQHEVAVAILRVHSAIG